MKNLKFPNSYTEGLKCLALAVAAGAAFLAGSTNAAPPVAGYTRWFDASTLGLTDNAGVSTWPDGSTNAADATVPAGNATPVYVANAGTETSLGAIYFAKNGGAGDSAALRFTRDSNIRTVFSVFKGNSFLLTDNDGIDFHRTGDDSPTDPLWAGYSDAINNGSTYVNGTLVDGQNYNMPTAFHNGFNLVEVLTDGNTCQADSFNKDRVYHAGNQYQAEVIIYDRVLSEEERVSVEHYLMHKWFGVSYALGVTLDSPANAQEYFVGSVTATATVNNGTAPFTVKFFSKKDSDVSYTQVGSDVTSPPYTVSLGALSAGTYQVYATVTDSAGTPATADSTTNTFDVVVATDNKGIGGTITYTDSNGLNPRSSPPYAPGYVVHTFANTGAGNLNVPADVTADVLVVGGGGGGGTTIAGGGGGGGLIYSRACPSTQPPWQGAWLREKLKRHER